MHRELAATKRRISIRLDSRFPGRGGKVQAGDRFLWRSWGVRGGRRGRRDDRFRPWAAFLEPRAQPSPESTGSRLTRPTRSKNSASARSAIVLVNGFAADATENVWPPESRARRLRRRIRVEFSGDLDRLARTLSNYGNSRASHVQAQAAQYQRGTYQPDPAATSLGMVREALASGPKEDRRTLPRGGRLVTGLTSINPVSLEVHPKGQSIATDDQPAQSSSRIEAPAAPPLADRIAACA